MFSWDVPRFHENSVFTKPPFGTRRRFSGFRSEEAAHFQFWKTFLVFALVDCACCDSSSCVAMFVPLANLDSRCYLASVLLPFPASSQRRRPNVVVVYLRLSLSVSLFGPASPSKSSTACPAHRCPMSLARRSSGPSRRSRSWRRSRPRWIRRTPQLVFRNMSMFFLIVFCVFAMSKYG